MITQTKINELTEKAKQIKKALKSNPKNVKLLVNILNSTTNSERQIIRTCYKRLYNKPIQNDIKEELNNKFKELCISLFDTPYEYDSRELYKSLNSIPIKYESIIEIFSSRNKSHLNTINQAYEQFFKISLKEVFQKKLPLNFSIFLLTIMDTNREEVKLLSNDDAYEYAKTIKNEDYKIFDNEKTFINIFLKQSREDLILISRAFFELYNINLYKYLKSLKNENIDKNNKKLIKSILFVIINPSEWFCSKIKKALIGPNIDFNQLNRIIIFRSEIDINIIRDYYFTDNKKELCKDIELIDELKDEDSYRDVLINLCMK